MLHTHEVEGSSPPVSTKRICVTVAHRTLTPFAGVRIPHPLPKRKPHHLVWLFFLPSAGDSNPSECKAPVEPCSPRAGPRRYNNLIESLILCPAENESFQFFCFGGSKTKGWISPPFSLSKKSSESWAFSTDCGHQHMPVAILYFTDKPGRAGRIARGSNFGAGRGHRTPVPAYRRWIRQRKDRS